MTLSQNVGNDKKISCTDELKMVKKMARAKDSELDQLQLRVKSSEGEFVQGTVCHCTVWHLCIYAKYNVCLCKC